MALVLGTNCGFVTVAPTDDPAAGGNVADAYSMVTRDTAPAGAIRITEIGWWCDNATEEANFEVGLYAADGAVVPGEAGTRLYVDDTNAKGTTAGWKRVTGLNWTITAGTAYWIAVQLDDTATATIIDVELSGGGGIDYITSSTTLPNPFDGGAFTWSEGGFTIYAVYEKATGGGKSNAKASIDWLQYATRSGL